MTGSLAASSVGDRDVRLGVSRQLRSDHGCGGLGHQNRAVTAGPPNAAPCLWKRGGALLLALADSLTAPCPKGGGARVAVMRRAYKWGITNPAEPCPRALTIRRHRQTPTPWRSAGGCAGGPAAVSRADVSEQRGHGVDKPRSVSIPEAGRCLCSSHAHRAVHARGSDRSAVRAFR